jgi:hypothetical protein
MNGFDSMNEFMNGRIIEVGPPLQAIAGNSDTPNAGGFGKPYAEICGNTGRALGLVLRRRSWGFSE